jgi:hypothetical protein
MMFLGISCHYMIHAWSVANGLHARVSINTILAVRILQFSAASQQQPQLLLPHMVGTAAVSVIDMARMSPPLPAHQ